MIDVSSRPAEPAHHLVLNEEDLAYEEEIIREDVLWPLMYLCRTSIVLFVQWSASCCLWKDGFCNIYFRGLYVGKFPSPPPSWGGEGPICRLLIYLQAYLSLLSTTSFFVQRSTLLCALSCEFFVVHLLFISSCHLLYSRQVPDQKEV